MKATLVTIEEAAHIAKVSSKTIMRWEKQGYIHHATRKNNTRYYSVEDIVKIKEIRDRPHFYLLQMYNRGILPETMRVVWEISYNEALDLDPEFRNNPYVGTLIDCTDYRKRIIGEKNTESGIFRSPVVMVFLKHFDQNHTGPVISSSNDRFVVLQPSSVCEVAFSMVDVWRECLNNKFTDNAQSLAPKSFLGFENIEKNGSLIGRYVRYERFQGKNWIEE